ncbi:hypothetical protein LRX75_17010 [Rhizobium sp. DKSPLA3]|uniref:Uncharacterized protein n=1 Tax=Rhizobium quercicola TaxID=2901226 RepID=A0A9X1NWT2_9HYPH|nr:hypothetical protein [Rhizobium quercicola]MCD7110736.1 hypothetical protein [Rhizobium quercicola]
MRSAYREMAVSAKARWLCAVRPVLISCAILAASCAASHAQAEDGAAPESGIGRAAPRLVDNALPAGASGVTPVPAQPVTPASVRRPPEASVAEKVDGARPVAGRTGFVLGLSWLPAFCEAKGKRPECVGQDAQRADAGQLTLAGLWPVRNSFCKVPETLQAEDRRRDWLSLPPVPLSAEVATRLATSMPGTASGLDRHTWLRSGSCQVLDPDAYFSLQIRLLEAVNTSAVGALFRNRIGGDVTEADVKAAFDASFAAGAGDRIRLQCRQVGNRVLVTGLTIGLSAAMEETSDLATLIHAAAPTTSRCSGGVVDAAGRARPERPSVVGQRAPAAEKGTTTLVDSREE